ncbi:MAG: hypothetical protein PHW60_15780 [Kiritimatiellae bacterium]|nr:hypothetical protein [Kiritimatiellia bacterium]
MEQSYCGLESLAWSKVIQMNERKWRAPFSVHLPLHPPHAKTFVYADCAFNAYTLPVPPDIRTHADGLRELLDGIETMIVQFAFETPAFVPDFRLARVELEQDRFPLAKLSYYAWRLLYEIEYFCARVDAGQSALWIRASVTNDGTEPRDAHVRVKVNFQKEKQLFDYHYRPFYWDASKWRPDHSVGLSNGVEIHRNGQLIGLAKPGDFNLAWEEAVSFKDDKYDDNHTPNFVQPCMRLKEAQDLLHFNGALAPGKCKTFALALLTDHAEITAKHRDALRSASMPAARQSALAEFKAIVDPATRAQLQCPQDGMDKIFAALQVGNYQMLIDFKNDKGLQPCQGGSSERFYVWVWEAMCMLMPMLPLGHFAPVKRVIEFIFTLQDGGCPPDGKFTSLAGAIGTTGPRWMNATASALALAAEYYRYSHDKNFLEAYMDRMLRAAYWIIGEIRATRKLNPDGTRPPVYGVLPSGRATDGDIGYIVAFSDAFSYYGLEKFAQLLRMVANPHSAEVAAEVAQYRRDLDKAVDHMRRADGFIDRKIVLEGDGSKIARGFNNICGAQQLAFTGVLDAQDPRFRQYAEYCEKNTLRGFFTGAMDLDVMYIGVGEHLWQHAWLCMGQWQKAYAALQTNLKYGMTHDALLVQERFSLSNPAFTPWQPNSSGNGRLLEMIIKQFYFEYCDVKHGETAVFFGGMPPAWFEINPTMSLKGLFTPQGRLSVETAGFEFKINCPGFSLRNKTIRIPEYFDVKFGGDGAQMLGGGFFKVVRDTQTLTGMLTAVAG